MAPAVRTADVTGLAALAFLGSLVVEAGSPASLPSLVAAVMVTPHARSACAELQSAAI